MIPSVVMGLTSKFKRLGLFMSTMYVADEMNFWQIIITLNKNDLVS